ncbi:hypothetical protein [Legionella sp. WA2022007384]
MFAKGILFSSEFTWDNDLSIKKNVCNIMRGYIPYGFNILTQKTHVADAKALVLFLETNTTVTEFEIYMNLQAMRQVLKDEQGEYKVRLNFCVQKIEEQNSLLKTLGVAGQAFNTVFGVS